MQISSESVTDLTTCGYLSRDDLDRSLDDLLSWMEGEESIRYSESSIEFDHICHDLPSFFYGEHGFGFLFEAIRCIDVLDFLQSFGVLESSFELWSQESLFADSLDGSHFCLVESLFSLLHIDDIADLILIEISSPLLAISSDEWYGRALGCELEYDLDLVAFQRECRRDQREILWFCHRRFWLRGLYG